MTEKPDKTNDGTPRGHGFMIIYNLVSRVDPRDGSNAEPASDASSGRLAAATGRSASMDHCAWMEYVIRLSESSRRVVGGSPEDTRQIPVIREQRGDPMIDSVTYCQLCRRIRPSTMRTATRLVKYWV
jgi:hypothetical protein